MADDKKTWLEFIVKSEIYKPYEKKDKISSDIDSEVNCVKSSDKKTSLKEAIYLIEGLSGNTQAKKIIDLTQSAIQETVNRSLTANPKEHIIANIKDLSRLISKYNPEKEISFSSFFYSLDTAFAVNIGKAKCYVWNQNEVLPRLISKSHTKQKILDLIIPKELRKYQIIQKLNADIPLSFLGQKELKDIIWKNVIDSYVAELVKESEVKTEEEKLKLLISYFNKEFDLRLNDDTQKVILTNLKLLSNSKLESPYITELDYHDYTNFIVTSSNFMDLYQEKNVQLLSPESSVELLRSNILTYSDNFNFNELSENFSHFFSKLYELEKDKQINGPGFGVSIFFPNTKNKLFSEEAEQYKGSLLYAIQKLCMRDGDFSQIILRMAEEMISDMDVFRCAEIVIEAMKDPKYSPSYFNPLNFEFFANTEFKKYYDAIKENKEILKNLMNVKEKREGLFNKILKKGPSQKEIIAAMEREDEILELKKRIFELENRDFTKELEEVKEKYKEEQEKNKIILEDYENFKQKLDKQLEEYRDIIEEKNKKIKKLEVDAKKPQESSYSIESLIKHLEEKLSQEISEIEQKYAVQLETTEDKTHKERLLEWCKREKESVKNKYDEFIEWLKKEQPTPLRIIEYYENKLSEVILEKNKFIQKKEEAQKNRDMEMEKAHEEKYRAIISQKNQEIANKNQEISQKNQRIAELEQQIKLISSKKETKEIQKALKEQETKYSKEIKRLEDESKSKDEKLKSYEKIIIEKSDNIEDLEAKLKDSIPKEEYDNKVREAAEKEKEYQKQLQVREDELKNLREEYENATRQVSNIEKEYQKQLKLKEAEIANLNKNIEKTQQNSEYYEKEKSKQQKVLKEKEDKIKEYENKISELESLLQNLKEIPNVKELQEKQKQLENSISEKNAYIIKIEEELKELKEKYQLLEKESLARKYLEINTKLLKEKIKLESERAEMQASLIYATMKILEYEAKLNKTTVPIMPFNEK